ncbi:hypothetical protein LTR35_017750 [Friedmanniomyces endolithicus]|uniref:Deacetylase sirtuin-type domain-containing protein n=1 Tax=Friedmanniomyces endolithicus TaxID=329885 RepID=A0AAN6IZW6_9PEZI|nr:hypothetical protein LTR35_017750 [Friedmanniomyces endolithicus]KAK0268437.1 hypothetical protein LTS00_017565 [Friedmanniomyces endolithicus]KAK0302607.1 hypothetical protein LTR82_017818 [Friedmanniomyces endolithicus]KAK0971361.1 hypothetical protein LTR54_017811 [Friedmanniomyces endolithicus]
MADPDTDSDLSSLPSLSPSPPPEDRSLSPPSSPLSFLSRSPTPTGFLEADRASMANRPHPKVKILVPYPSPPASQQTSASGSPSPDGMDSGIDGRPTKRRRISRDPKNRSTEYLDLRSGTVSADQQENLDRVLDTLLTRRKIVAIAGAGMSRSAGVPDFRSKEGLFSSLKKEHNLKGSGQHLFDASVYKNDVSTEQFHSMISQMSRLTKDAQPTQFHHMLATMAQDDRLLRLYSQNVDGLDTNMEPLRTRTPLTKDAHGKWPRTVQLHGGLDKMVCTKCREVSDLNADLFDGQDAPLCPTCEVVDDIRTVHEGKRSHGIGRLRPRMVLYHEQGPDENAIGNCSRLVKEMCKVVRNRKDGGLAIWINPDPPPAAGGFRDCFDIIVQGTCDEVAKRAAVRKWDEPAVPDDFSEVSEEDAVKIAAKNAQVLLPKCQLTHASAIRLPSADHKNNSFPPPPRDTTPPPVMNHGPKDWSPISSRHSSVFSSIEVGENVVLGTTIHDGLATPKSSRSTPAKKQPTAFDQLKDKKAKKAPRKTSTSSAMSKKIAANAIKGVKPRSKVKPAASKSKPQLSTAKTASITNAFTQSKSASTAIKSAGAKKNKDLASSSPARSPSKLRQVANVSVAAEEPVSPSKTKTGSKSSPGKAKSASRFPNLAVGGAERGSKRKSVGV